jgi:pyrroloquinoline quinone biosynthesis protein D
MAPPTSGVTRVRRDPDRPALSPDAVLRDEGDRALVFLPESDRVLEVNSTGQAILRLMDGSRSIDGIADALAERFETTPERARADVAAYVKTLVEQGLIRDD